MSHTRNYVSQLWKKDAFLNYKLILHYEKNEVFQYLQLVKCITKLRLLLKSHCVVMI